MKWLAYILSFYLVVLSVVPCADHAPTQINTTAAVADQPVAHHDQAPENDLCTPLCLCACCGAITFFTPQLAAISSQLNSFSKPHATYQTLARQAVTLPIWQPPKLS